MKKILASLLIFFSVIVVVDKVSAGTIDNNIVYFDTLHENFTSVYNELKPKLEEIKGILSNNPLGYKYVIYFGKNSSGNFINVYLMSNTTVYGDDDLHCFIRAYKSGSGVYGQQGGCYSYPSTVPYAIARYEYTSSNSSSYNTLITNLSHDINSNWSSSSFLGYFAAGDALINISNLSSFTFSSGQYDYFNKNSYFVLPYISNVPIYNYYKYIDKVSTTYYGLKIGENEVLYNQYLEASDNYVSPGYKNKETTSFNKQIHSFDIYVDKSEKLSDLSYKLNYIDNNDYTNGDMSKAKLYGVVFYGLKNENGLYHWELLDDCTNWDFPSEYCHVKSKYEQLESETNDVGYTVEGYVDFLDVFDTYDKVRIVARLDNAFNGKISYLDKNNKISSSDLDINYFGFDYARNINQSEANRYVIFTTKEQDLTDNMFIVSPSEDIFVDYFDTKEASFREYTRMRAFEKNENTYIFNYMGIGLKNNLGFYILTDKNRTENLKYNFYIKPHLYFSFNNSNTLEDTIYIDNEGNIVSGDIAITPDELVGYKYDSIDDLFENIEKFNEKINTVSEKIHEVIQYAYDSLNNDIKAFLLAIFTVILVSGTIILIRR